MADRSVSEMIARGMARQLALLRTTLAAGTPRVGWKIGINDPAFQRLLGLSAPVVGWLNGNHALASGDSYEEPAAARLFAEAEVAVRVSADVPAGLSADQADAFIAGLAPAIELVDYSLSTASFEEVLAGSILHAAVVFGGERDVEPAKVLDSKWPIVVKNGGREREPGNELVPRSFGAIVAMVATELDGYGERLAQGDRVITGSFVEPLPVAGGDLVHVDFGPLGAVEVNIARRSEHGG